VDGSSEKEHLRKRSKDLFESILEEFVKEIDGTALYDRLWDCGYHFGQSFKRIKAAKQAASGKAWAEVSIVDTLGSDIPKVIHPATLDGILQIMLPGAAESGKESRLATSVPTRINRLWIARNGLRYEETHSIEVAGTMEQTGYRNSSSNVVAFDQDDSLRVVGDGIETTAITDSAQEMSTQLEFGSTLCWNIIHKPDMAILNHAQLEAYLIQDSPTRAASTEYLRDLDVILYASLLDTNSRMEKMGPQKSNGHLDFYMRWMRLQLQAGNEEIAEAKRMLQDNTIYNHLLHKVARQHPKRSGICYRVVGELFNVLSGRLDPLNLIFQGTDLSEFYENLLDLADFTTPLARWLDLLTHKHPNTSVLEVGAGTGGLTKHVMKTLVQQGSRGATARYSKYVFTDISPSFFTHGKETFNDCPRMEFRTLDPEMDISAQGYEPGSFDVILASLVLHATSSLDQSLTHLKTLLKPGGKLIAVEITNPESLSAGFVFGLLPGWWLSDDAERKGRLGPCLKADEWHRILKRNGFSGLDHVFLDKEDATHHHLSLFISTKEHMQPSIANSGPSSSTIIGANWANAFHVRSCEEVMTSFGIHPERKQFTCINEIDQVPGNLLIIFDNASHSILHELGDGKFERFSKTILGASDVLWITHKHGNISYPDSGTVYGFARALRSENASLRFTILESDISTTFEEQRINIVRILETIMGTSSHILESEIADKDAMPHIPRVIEDVSLNRRIRDGRKHMIRQHVKFADGNLRLTVKIPGLLDTLYFERAADRPAELGLREVEIRVRAIRVNFKDCLIALGRIPDKSISTDCSGVVERVGRDCTAKPGDRVAVLALNTYSSIVRCHEDLIVTIPDFLPFTEAAKLPTNFVTAYHALIEVGRLTKGESVLIHAGAGGTGQAAIQIAKCFGADVFVTVGSQSKRELLIANYSIPEDRIFYSRDVSFAKGIKCHTNSRGVDLILNSLAGKQLMAS
jgi:SAM-dependent methyltransferase